jgi:acyl dehydratase
MSIVNFENIGKEAETTYEYTWKDVILYAVGIGAHTDELPFIYERHPEGLKVFPSFASIIARGAIRHAAFNIKLDPTKDRHGEEYIRMYAPIPPQGKIIRKGKILHVYDKGSGSSVVTQVSGFDESGSHIFDQQTTGFNIGSGGFGGDRGPKTKYLNPPGGKEPDFSISYKTTENQAALYRLSGDYNPLHIDPDFARRGGQEKPIIHGLCTYGFATRAILYGLCDGDLTRFKEFKGRFSAVAYPGDTLTTEGWKENGRYIIQVKANDTVVLSNAYCIVV